MGSRAGKGRQGRERQGGDARAVMERAGARHVPRRPQGPPRARPRRPQPHAPPRGTRPCRVSRQPWPSAVPPPWPGFLWPGAGAALNRGRESGSRFLQQAPTLREPTDGSTPARVASAGLARGRGRRLVARKRPALRGEPGPGLTRSGGGGRSTAAGTGSPYPGHMPHPHTKGPHPPRPAVPAAASVQSGADCGADCGAL